MKERINNLRQELTKHNYNYYVLNKPTIDDFEFDMLMNELIQLELEHPEFFDKNSPSQRVGDDRKIEGFNQVKHKYQMLSLANTYSIDEINDFHNRIKKEITDKFNYSCELKFDGASLSIVYINGELDHAVTRGDGEEGDDVTNNVRTIKNVPLKLQTNNPPTYLEVRGEVVMKEQNFILANNNRLEQNKDLFKNKRNAASGTLKQYNSSVVANIGLSFMPFQVIGDIGIDSHYDRISKIEEYGFQITNKRIIASDLNEINDFIDKINIERKSYDFDIDGIVIKVDNIKLYENIGYTAKNPKWATSYKFKAEQLSTKLISIDYQVGRTGIITPVANLEPIELAGTTVRRASMHNEEQIKKYDIRVNDYVFVEKGGEIIPKIVGVDFPKRDVNSIQEKFIEYCPECGTKLVKNVEDANHFCPNKTTCKPQIIGKIEHFCSKKGMNIEIGEPTIKKMVELKLIGKYQDLYSLTIDDIKTIEGFKDRSATKLYESIQNSKKQPFQKVLYSLGIDNVGQGASKDLIKNGFNTIDLLKNAKYGDIVKISGFGDTIANSILNWFSNQENKEALDILIGHGLNFEEEIETIDISSNKLEGKSFLLTGFKENIKLKLNNTIVENGGILKSGVSKNLDYLVCGETAGPSKMKKAEDLNINIITQEDLENMFQ